MKLVNRTVIGCLRDPDFIFITDIIGVACLHFLKCEAIPFCKRVYKNIYFRLIDLYTRETCLKAIIGSH